MAAAMAAVMVALMTAALVTAIATGSGGDGNGNGNSDGGSGSNGDSDGGYGDSNSGSGSGGDGNIEGVDGNSNGGSGGNGDGSGGSHNNQLKGGGNGSSRRVGRWVGRAAAVQCIFCYSYFFSLSLPLTLNAKATERALPQGASRACYLCCYPQFTVGVVGVVFVFFRCLHPRRCCVRCHHHRCHHCFFRWIF
jgi:hypothetical protein